MTDPIEKRIPLKLELNISDSTIVQYLAQFESPLREAKAEEALKVGVIAIMSASPSLDTKVVEEKFNEVDKKIREYADEFQKALSEELRCYFEKEKGTLPSTLQSFLGDKGLLGDSLKSYFDDKTGKVKLFLANELGPGSEFSKALDPTNKASVIARIEIAVNKQLAEVTQGLTDQFSLDKAESGMSRIKRLFDGSIAEIKSANESFFNELREHLKIQKAIAMEAEKGTQKGRDFESELYDRVAVLGQQLQDRTENVTSLVGELPRTKTGDYVITLGETSGSPGKRIVVEAKMGQSYTLKDAMTELKEAKENRRADAGIFVFAKGYEPIEIGDFKIDGSDFYCTVESEAVNIGAPITFFEAAYKISRVMLIAQVRKEIRGVIDPEKIKECISLMVKQAELMTDIITKARTVRSHGEAIENSLKSIKENLDFQIQSTLDLLK